MEKNSKIYIAGHTGLTGSAVYKRLKLEGYTNIIVRNHESLDLLDQKKVFDFFKEVNPEYVIDCAAKVGGIKENINKPEEFISENLSIQLNLMQAALKSRVKKFVFLGTNCMYPANCNQPLKEDYLFRGPPEETNASYAIAKLAGLEHIKAIRKQHKLDFICIIPASLYGPGDRHDLQRAHFIPSLIKRLHEAKINNQGEIVLWGSGKPLREYLFVEDFAEATLFLMDNYLHDEPINIGTDEEHSISEIAQILKKIIGFKGEIKFDNVSPDGALRKVLDNTKMKNQGFIPKTRLEEGLRKTYDAFLKNE